MVACPSGATVSLMTRRWIWSVVCRSFRLAHDRVGIAMLCSGPADATDLATHIDPAFVTKVDNVCSTANAMYTKALGTTPPFPTFNPAKPDPADFEEGRHLSAKGGSHRPRAVTGLRQLGQPSTGRRAWAEMRMDVAQFEALTIDQEKSALAVQPGAFARQNTQIGEVATKLAKTALASGFPSGTPCSTTF